MPPAGSNHGSTREERAVANYRNIFPGPSGTQTAHQSGQRASGSVALANSFASSWPSLGSSGGRQLALSQLDLGLFRQQETKTQPMRTFPLCVTVNALSRMPCFFLSYGTRVNLKCLMTKHSCCLISSGWFAC